MFIGYNTIFTRYRLYDFENDAIGVSRDVVFNEHSPSKGVDYSLDLLGDSSNSFAPSSTLHSPSFDDVSIDDGGLGKHWKI